MKKIKITIEGMHCASCASNVEKSLKKITGIREASISLMLKKGIIEAEENISEEKLKKAVSKAGYKISKVEYGSWTSPQRTYRGFWNKNLEV